MFPRIAAASAVLILQLGCGNSSQRIEPQVNSTSTKEATNSNYTDQRPSGNLNKHAVANLCTRVFDIRIVPLKGERGRHQPFDAIMDGGDAVLPCLIDKVTDPKKIVNPFEFPRYAGIDIRRGDVAFFLILYMKHVTAEKFLPDIFKKDYEKEGIHAYFKYAQKPANRRQVQENLRVWFTKKIVHAQSRSAGARARWTIAMFWTLIDGSVTA